MSVRGLLIMVNAANRSREMRIEIDPLHLSTCRSSVTVRVMALQREAVKARSEGVEDDGREWTL